jgi:hypothetical protein
VTRIGVAPLDIRIEALMYAQEGSFFIIPGAWFNPNPNDTVENFLQKGFRPEEALSSELASSTRQRRVDPFYPFFQQPMDIRITFCGSISENLTAEVADQGAWMQKWGWVPTFYGSTGLKDIINPPNTYPSQGAAAFTVHGVSGVYPGGNASGNGKGTGITFEFDQREVMPYAPAYSSDAGKPLRPSPYNPTQPLPFAPRLPVAPGLLYYGQNTQTR